MRGQGENQFVIVQLAGFGIGKLGSGAQILNLCPRGITR